MASRHQRLYLDDESENSSVPPWTIPCPDDGAGRSVHPVQDGDDSDALELPVRRSLIHPDGSSVSDLRQRLRERGTRITFDTEVKLDDGQHRSLDAPLPKPTADDIAESPTKLFAIPIRQRPRRHSETEKGDFDPLTGAPLVIDRRGAQSYHQGEMRHPLLQSTVDDLARESRVEVAEKIPSLTSETTASLPRDELPTPTTEHADHLTISPISYAAAVQSGALPSRRSVSQRSFGSLGSVGRRHNIKSAGSSLSSPARSFLSQWGHGDSVREPEPDEEGQEIADTGYIIGRKIGFGGFSVVKEVSTIEDDRRVVRAVKIVRKQIRDKSDVENERLQQDFDREVDVWRCLKNKNILPLILVYHTDFATYCITQLNEGGTLFDLIRSQRKKKGKYRGIHAHLARRYSYQLGSAIRYLHEDVRVVHRDIKPENCLLDMSGANAAVEGGNILLCDFGMADFINHESMHDDSDASGLSVNIGPSQTSTSIQGSLDYAAPELFNTGHSVFSTSADVWAYGCVIYTMLTCEKPFQHEFQPRLTMMISRGEYDTAALENCCAVIEDGPSAIDVVKGCLTLDHVDRMSISHALDSPWLEGCKELLEEPVFD